MAPVIAVSGGMRKFFALALILVAVFIGVGAQPARAQQTPDSVQPAQQDTLPKTGKGEWWEYFRKQANAGSDLSRGLRLGVVKGCMEGFDVSLMMQSQIYDEYKKRRDALMRSDLTMDQVLAKMDGYFAEPGNQTSTICVAVLAALRPPAEK